MKMSNSLHFFACILLATSGIHLQAQDIDSAPTENLNMYVTEDPGGLSGMIESADLVVIGRIEEIIDEFVFYGYDTDMREQYRQLEKDLQTTLGIRFIDYRVSVEEVLKNSPNGHLLASVKSDEISQKEPISLIFRKPANGPVDLGIDMMLFLSINPDGKTYGVSSLTGQLYLADSNISYYDIGAEKFVIPQFGRDLKVIELSGAIKEFAATLHDQ